ncbi:MAG: excinuclease ABC subunit UvrA [Clostridia bacterium]|nr:excinuclease ABC subunit UvrA [Clostridia bacterium]
MLNDITIKGARQNNLKDISLTLPKNKLIVFTGLSGSGKSSLAFETLFAEGQRRYVESLSSYARQFLGQMDKPDVDSIDGLCPTISIDQKTTSQNPRSTVGTVTEIYDYLRLLYARIGVPHCVKCGREIKSVTIDQIVSLVAKKPEKTKIMILSPVVRDRKGEYKNLFEQLKKDGFTRVVVDNEVRTLDEEIVLDKNFRHNISVVIDRIVIKPEVERRLTESIEIALKKSEGIVQIQDMETNNIELFSTNYACPNCGTTIGEITPRMFSFNAPVGACQTCSGLGFTSSIDLKKLIPDDSLSLEDGAIKCTGWNLDVTGMYQSRMRSLSKKYKFSMRTPFKDLPENIKNIVLFGDNEKIEITESSKNYTFTFNEVFEGIVNNLERRYRTTQSDGVRGDIEKLMATKKCPECGGNRLKKEVLAITVNDKNIMDICDMPVCKINDFFDSFKYSEREEIIAKPILKELKKRINFLNDVGLGYLTLSRYAATLSGGEAQRIRLATQIGSGLTGVLYILDEPSIGLHQSDNDKLIATLLKLRDLGNTLVVVEHDEDTIRAADYIVDIGPGAGVHGGELVACGSLNDIISNPNSITGQYLSGVRKIDVPTEHRPGNGKSIVVYGAAENNLKNIDIEVPLGKFVAITGVSGSGKSSFVNGILYPYLANTLNNASCSLGNFREIQGTENLDKVICIDQSPIGRMPGSNPATYTGVFTAIRELFASTQDAKSRGYKAGRFSFNVKGGRCENCSGNGLIKIEMNFLPDVYVPCEVCKGKRYTRETLEIKYKGKNIYDVLQMTIDEACEFFKNIPKIYNKIKTIQDVGLGYIKLGQPAPTFSGGEAQRIKLSTELSKRSTGNTMYILDEPTTGLHVYDVEKLIKILNKLVNLGNTVLVIEHNLDVIRQADHIIDLGPEGGDEGGTIVVSGTPEEVRDSKKGYTSKYI